MAYSYDRSAATAPDSLKMLRKGMIISVKGVYYEVLAKDKDSVTAAPVTFSLDSKGEPEIRKGKSKDIPLSDVQLLKPGTVLFAPTLGKHAASKIDELMQLLLVRAEDTQKRTRSGFDPKNFYKEYGKSDVDKAVSLLLRKGKIYKGDHGEIFPE